MRRGCFFPFTPTASYLVSLLSFCTKYQPFKATRFSHPPSALPFFLHSLFSLPLLLAQPLCSRLPGSCCSLYSLTSCLASCLLLHSHTQGFTFKPVQQNKSLYNLSSFKLTRSHRDLLTRQHSPPPETCDLISAGKIHICMCQCIYVRVWIFLRNQTVSAEAMTHAPHGWQIIQDFSLLVWL